MATSLIKSMGRLSSTSTPLAVTDKSENDLGDVGFLTLMNQEGFALGLRLGFLKINTLPDPLLHL